MTHKDFLTLTINGKDYSVRPNFKAAAEIQARSGRTLVQSISAAVAFSVTDLHAILCGAMFGNGHPVDDDVFGKAIMDDFIVKGTPLCTQLLAFGSAFFPQVENDGTKKVTATNQKAG